MNYYEFNLELNPHEPWSEILMAKLSEIGFESFIENEKGFQAYIREDLFCQDVVSELFNGFLESCKIDSSIRFVEETNWNAVWESQYEPVTFGKFCHVRAPFHPVNPDVEFDLIIEPKMSFGTAHHETTSMMISWIERESFEGKDVLDMGCGTGILAILVAKKGAKFVQAIDNDEWAFENSKENVERNQEPQIDVKLGDASLLGDLLFDTIIANINRNILVEDMYAYAKCLKPEGNLFLSGFYEEDIPIIKYECEKHDLIMIDNLEKNRWVAVKFEKK